MAANYKKILTDLYLRYNAGKLGEVDELLRRFKGRERELIYKVYLKYGPEETRSDVREKLAKYFAEIAEKERLAATSSSVPARTRKRPSSRRISVLGIALALVGGLTYGGWRLAQGDWQLFPSAVEDSAPPPPPQYVLANAVYARNQCEGGQKTETFLRYGEALTNYTENGTCLLSDNDSTGSHNYFPAQYFVTEERFREIDAIFGNDAARSQIKHSFEKRALRKWFRQNGIIGKLSPEWKDSIAGKDRDPEVWQIFAEEEPSELNTWARGNFSRKFGEFSGELEDLVCIIQKPDDPTKRKLLFFSFDPSGNSKTFDAFDMELYQDRLIRDFPRSEDDLSRFARSASDMHYEKGVLVEDPEGKLQDYLLIWQDDHFSVLEEVPRDTFRIPGLPPIIL